MNGRCIMPHFLVAILSVASIFILILRANHPSYLKTSVAGSPFIVSQSTLLSEFNDHGVGGDNNDDDDDSTTTVDITDGEKRRQEQKIIKWQQWQKNQLSTQPRYSRKNRKRRIQLHKLEGGGGDLHSMQQLHDRRQLYSRIHSELMHQSPIYATIQRSLTEKHRIQWQMEQSRIRKQLRRQPVTRGGFDDSYDSSSSVFLRQMQPFVSHHHPLYQHQRPQNRRQLEDSFDNAFGTGRPGSTYGYNMFCGSSWADASTSCESRQNCPSGQSDECIMPGHQCWAFTECDTRFGHGEEFSEMHDVTGAENLMATGEGAVASGGFVDLSKPSYNKTDHYFCGVSYDDAISRCASHCASGSLNDCPTGEICFFDTPCDARMMTKGPSPPSPTFSPTTPAPVVYSSKLNKYFCGLDWNDAQQR
jgi:hypothetical protein